MNGLKPEEFNSSRGATLHAIYRYRSLGRDRPLRRLAGLPRHGALSLLLPRHGALSLSLGDVSINVSLNLAGARRSVTTMPSPRGLVRKTD